MAITIEDCLDGFGPGSMFSAYGVLDLQLGRSQLKMFLAIPKLRRWTAHFIAENERSKKTGTRSSRQDACESTVLGRGVWDLVPAATDCRKLIDKRWIRVKDSSFSGLKLFTNIQLQMVLTLEQINALRAGLSSIEPYAENCVRLEKIMHCRAFFPGGDGLWSPNRPGKAIRTLFLGSDFNNETNYLAEFVGPKSEMRDSPKTWTGLTALMNAASIDPDECFFTNAWPCLRKGDYPNSGDPPGAKDPAFTSRCLAFFRLTLEMLKPRYVISLGTWPTQFLSAIAPYEMRDWRRPKWRLIDRTDKVTLVLSAKPVTFIPAIHPCLPNHRYRSIHKTSSAEAMHIRGVMAGL